MIKGLFGPSSVSYALRGGMDEEMATHRLIGERVAGALSASSSVDFAGALKAGNVHEKPSESDLQRDMSSLADTQLRYEAEARLLQAAYGRLRASVSSGA